MQRDGGIGAGVADAVDVRGGEVEARARAKHAGARGPFDRKALLADGSADDGHGAGGDVVVVEAGVVLVHPADQPGCDVLVAEQLLVDALRGVVLDQMDPQLGPIGQLADERLELWAGEIASTRTGHTGHAAHVDGRRQREAGRADGAWRGGAHLATSRRAGLSARRVQSTIGPQSSPPGIPSSPGSTTGRSDPYSSCSGPTSSSSIPTAAGP